MAARKSVCVSGGLQIAACIAANSFYLPDGAVLGYSAILIPQLELPESEIVVTRLQTAWLSELRNTVGQETGQGGQTLEMRLCPESFGHLTGLPAHCEAWTGHSARVRGALR